jgi:hypothetical protein
MPTIHPKPPTLDDIKRMAREIGVTFTDTRDSFTLVKQEPHLNETYRKNRAGINTAHNALVYYGRLSKDPSARLAVAEEYLRQNRHFWQGMVNTMQRHVKKGTNVELSREEAFDLRNKLSNEELEEDLRRMEEEENKEQLQTQNSFETIPSQQPGQTTIIIGTTSYDAEIELSQSHVEAALMFARKKGRKEINFVVSNVASEVDLVVLSVKNPRWPRVLEKTTLSFEEARLLRDLLVRPEISVWLERG